MEQKDGSTRRKKQTQGNTYNEGFPREILNQRRDLIKHLRTGRGQGYKAILLYIKVKINGNM